MVTVIRDDNIVGRKLASLREKYGYSQVELAKRLNVSPSTIGMWEVGERELKASTLIKVADFFDVSIDYLTGRSKEEQLLKKNKIGEKLKDIRESLGLTIEEFSEKLSGIPIGNIKSWENNTTFPTHYELTRISEVTRISIDDILIGDDDLTVDGVKLPLDVQTILRHLTSELVSTKSNADKKRLISMVSAILENYKRE